LIDFSDSGIPLCENIGYNLLVFASSSKRLAFLFLCFWNIARMDSGWSAIWNTSKSLGGSSQFPHFPKIGRLAAPVGYICWDFSILRRGGIIRLDDMARSFRRLYESHSSFCRKVDTGYPLISMVGQRQRWSGDICDAVEAALLQRKETKRARSRRSCFAFKITPVAGY
jgi:hypothetical protein